MMGGCLLKSGWLDLLAEVEVGEEAGMELSGRCLIGLAGWVTRMRLLCEL